MDTQDPILFETYFKAIEAEALRLENKYSRYKKDNIVHTINSAQGQTVEVDEETASLIDFAFYCYELSEGLFDITSGVLRGLWDFKNVKTFPSDDEIKKYLKRVGLKKVLWMRPTLQLEAGMEFDFGGIVKEYAVDKCLALLKPDAPATLVNFGGDLAVNKAPKNSSWSVAIEEAFKGKIPGGSIELRSGALATSGDTHRFFEHNGERYMHILNPRTGYPIVSSVATVTVHADSCTMAGMLATISHLQKSPESFLKDQEVQHWILRHI